MASSAQIQANRSNAQKSTGPRTAQGKATASHNAVKHGLLAEQVVIHGEDPAQFDLYREGMLAELTPGGEIETMLAERRIESSLYRTMAELRKEQEARKAAEASHSQDPLAVDRKVNKVNKVPAPHSNGGLAIDREPAIPAQLASFGESVSEDASSDSSDFPLLEEKMTSYGVTTNEDRATQPLASSQGQDHRQTSLPLPPGIEERRSDLTFQTSHLKLASASCETNPIPAGRPVWSREL